MVCLMILRKDRIPKRVMGHDVKQFKALEGYLESGPQFVLQSYILLRGKRRGFGDLQEADVERILLLLFTIALSLASLTSTAVKVNKPDPDDNRTSKQTPPSSSGRFYLTSLLFNGFCVIFRLSSTAFAYATLRAWANLILVSAFFANVILLGFIGT